MVLPEIFFEKPGKNLKIPLLNVNILYIIIVCQFQSMPPARVSHAVVASHVVGSIAYGR